jgi:ribosomal-protein-alanine N-acetyltransferase
MIDVLQATPAHAEVVALIHASATQDPWPAPFVGDLLEKSSVLGLLAMEKGDPLGFVLVQKATDEAEVLQIAAHPKAQRRGIARKLLVTISKQLRLSGTSVLFLDVAEDNVPARALYEGLGFIEVGRRPRYYVRASGKVDGLLLRLNLVEGEPRTK